MSDAELEHLLQMAGDLERNLAAYADVEARIADHLRRFWAPSMRRRLAEYAAQSGDRLSPTLRAALDQLEA